MSSSRGLVSGLDYNGTLTGDGGRPANYRRVLKSLWSQADDVTISGGWDAYEQGWAAVERLEWAASCYSEGWLDRENLLEGVDQDIGYSVDIERSGGGSTTPPRSARRRCG